MTKTEIEQIIKKELLKHKNIKLVYLFDSITTEQFTDQSGYQFDKD